VAAPVVVPPKAPVAGPVAAPTRFFPGNWPARNAALVTILGIDLADCNDAIS
jgi:hypothetical protein